MEKIIFVLTFIIALLLVKMFIDWIVLKDRKESLEQLKQEIKAAGELLNKKDSEFRSYKKNVTFERNLIAEGFVKSLFVLENEPKFPKGYDCKDFVVMNVEPLLFKNINTHLDEVKKLENNSAKTIEFLIYFAKIKNDLTSKKLNIEEIQKLRPDVFYSYTVFSKLDKKQMIVREEYLESLIQGRFEKGGEIEN